MPTEKEIFAFWFCLALTFIGLGYFIQQLQRAGNKLWIDPPSERIIYTQPAIVLSEENERAKAELDKRTGHIWTNKNALRLLELEKEYGIQFDRKLPRLFAQFGIDGIACLIKWRQHEDVVDMSTRIED